MKKIANQYTCVSCDFYETLELFSMQKTQVKISYKDESNNSHTLISFIKTLTTRNKEEFLTTLSGLEIRLDRVIEMNKV